MKFISLTEKEIDFEGKILLSKKIPSFLNNTNQDKIDTIIEFYKNYSCNGIIFDYNTPVDSLVYLVRELTKIDKNLKLLKIVLNNSNGRYNVLEL